MKELIHQTMSTDSECDETTILKQRAAVLIGKSDELSFLAKPKKEDYLLESLVH